MTQDPFAKSLYVAVKKSSQSRLQTFCQIDGVDLATEKSLDERQSYSNMVLVLLSGDSVKLVLKLFFNVESAEDFFENSPQKDHSENALHRCAVDTFKEVLNLVAGHMKILLEQVGATSDISLPVAMRGYDDMFFPISENTATESVCRLSYKNSEIYLCSSVTFKGDLKTKEVKYRDETSSVELL